MQVWDRFTSLEHPSKFQRVSRLGFVTAATSLSGGRRPTKLCTMFGRFLGCYTIYIYIFGGSCPRMEFCQVQNWLCVQVLRSPILSALLHGTAAAGVSQTSRHGTRNGITELSQTAPHIFGWAAITLGIGPHYSYFLWSPYGIGQTIIFSCCSLFFPSYGRPM